MKRTLTSQKLGEWRDRLAMISPPMESEDWEALRDIEREISEAYLDALNEEVSDQLRQREQKLVDACFAIALLVSDPNLGFGKLSNEEKATYVAAQLRALGFDTAPCGASWGVLK
jgi:hypothetical protein